MRGETPHRFCLITLTPAPFLLRFLLRRKVQGNLPWLPACRAIGPQDRSHFTGSPLKGEGVFEIGSNVIFQNADERRYFI